MFFLIPLALLVGALSTGIAVELTQGSPEQTRPSASSAAPSPSAAPAQPRPR